MKNKIRINHIAVVLPDVETAAQLLAKYNFNIGAVDFFESLGTKEIYVEQNKSASLLLMQPTKAGSYQEALDKRGPSLHHIAVDVVDLDQFIKDVTNAGWQLHPNSAESIKRNRVAWLMRSGFPALFEVAEVKKISVASEFVGGIKLSTDRSHKKLIDALGLNPFIEITQDETQLLLDGQYLKISELV